MGREDCNMCHFLGNKMYCSYYDFAYASCSSIKVCPDGLDGDDEEKDSDNLYEYDNID